MVLFMIAYIRKDKNTTLGFRILDTKIRKTTIIPYSIVLTMLISREIVIENLRVDNGKVKGYNGSIDRYTVIDANQQLISEQSIVILAKKSNELFICSDFRGSITEVHQSKLIENSKLANGKIVNTRISAIEGTYKNEDMITSKTINQRVHEYEAKAKLLGL